MTSFRDEAENPSEEPRRRSVRVLAYGFSGQDVLIRIAAGAGPFPVVLVRLDRVRAQSPRSGGLARRRKIDFACNVSRMVRPAGGAFLGDAQLGSVVGVNEDRAVTVKS